MKLWPVNSVFSVRALSRQAASGLFKNYMFLSIYQVINFLVPLIIYPLVIKKIGLVLFGKVAFSYAFASYFNVITDYGFNLSGTRAIALKRGDNKAVSKIYSNIMAAKLLLLLVCAIIFVLLLQIPFFKNDYTLHILSFTIVLGQVLMPVWLFQGMEDMKYLACFNGIAKIFFAVGIVFFIRQPQHYVLVNLLQGGGVVLAALACHFIAWRKYDIRFITTNAREIYVELKEGFVLFLSSFAVSVYVISNVFILGLLAGPAAAGYYSIAEKVYFALKQLPAVFSQVIFPRVCQLTSKSAEHLVHFLNRVTIPFVVFLLIICVATWFGSEWIAHYFLPGAKPGLPHLIRILSVVPIIVALDVPAFQSLLAYNEKSRYGIILVSGCLLNIVINIFLSRSFGAEGTAWSVLLTELYITVGLMIMFGKTIQTKKQPVLYEQ